MMMTKQKIKTIVTTVLLIIAAQIMYFLDKAGIIQGNAVFKYCMLMMTVIYVFIGCMLQTFGHRKAAIVLGIISFFVTCTCLFYSTSFLDYGIFVICMILIMRKSVYICGEEGCDNPLA